jgi:hypothetical protein
MSIHISTLEHFFSKIGLKTPLVQMVPNCNLQDIGPTVQLASSGTIGAKWCNRRHLSYVMLSANDAK